MARALSTIRRAAADDRGSTIVEFAILLPLLVCLLFGILAYGQYFLLAHSVQELANDAARATVAGLNVDERRALAVQSVSDDVAALQEIDGDRVATTVAETADTVTVRVRLDAAGAALFHAPLVPLPDPVIERRAVVRPGGIT